MKSLLASLFAVLLVVVHGVARAEEPARVALVIANEAYASVPSLDNPRRDAAHVSAAFERAGFTVVRHHDLTNAQMGAALRDFKRRADVADVAAIYYAGHGIELEGTNWLLPVDATLADPADALVEAVSLSEMLRFVAGARQLRIIVLDACRDNPFALRLTSATRGLAPGLRPVENLPAETLIAYSASSGQRALDGASGDISPFARAFARRLQEPGLEVRFLFANVRDDVLAATGTRRQRPWLGIEMSARRVVLLPDRAVSDRAAEFAAFQTASAVWTAEGWRAFLEAWPSGTYAPVADKALEALEATAPTVSPEAELREARRALDAVTAGQWSAAEPSELVSAVLGGTHARAVERLSGVGDPRAQAVLAIGHAFAVGGLGRDLTRAARLARSSAAQGFAPAMWLLAKLASEGAGMRRDDAAAVALLAPAVEDGHAGAQGLLGHLYLNGRGVPRDPAEAARLLRLAADQGEVYAISNLGYMYENGFGGLERDEAEAARLYGLAAARGNALGQHNLAWMVWQGHGVASDPEEAVRLFTLAVEGGGARNAAHLGWMTLHGLGGLQPDEKRGVSLIARSVEAGNGWGMAYLGSLYLEGAAGLERDEARALKLFRAADAMDNKLARTYLGRMYERGLGGLRRDRAEAIERYRQAARQGERMAQGELERLGQTW